MLIIENTRYADEPMKIAHTRLLGSNAKIMADAMRGVTMPSNPYLSKTLIVWTTRWDFVMPINALGLRLKAPMNLCLNLLGIAE